MCASPSTIVSCTVSRANAASTLAGTLRHGGIARACVLFAVGRVVVVGGGVEKVFASRARFALALRFPRFTGATVFFRRFAGGIAPPAPPLVVAAIAAIPIPPTVRIAELIAAPIASNESLASSTPRRHHSDFTAEDTSPDVGASSSSSSSRTPELSTNCGRPPPPPFAPEAAPPPPPSSSSSNASSVIDTSGSRGFLDVRATRKPSSNVNTSPLSGANANESSRAAVISAIASRASPPLAAPAAAPAPGCFPYRLASATESSNECSATRSPSGVTCMIARRVPHGANAAKSGFLVASVSSFLTGSGGGAAGTARLVVVVVVAFAAFAATPPSLSSAPPPPPPPPATAPFPCPAVLSSSPVGPNAHSPPRCLPVPPPERRGLNQGIKPSPAPPPSSSSSAPPCPPLKFLTRSVTGGADTTTTHPSGCSCTPARSSPSGAQHVRCWVVPYEAMSGWS